MSSMHSTPHHGTPAPDQGGYERSDLNPRPVLISVAIATVALVLVFVAMWVLTDWLGMHAARTSPPANPLAAVDGRRQPPAPRLQSDPIKDIATLHATENAQLQSYGWVDKPSGVVRIPIDRALDLLAQRGLPARAARQLP